MFEINGRKIGEGHPPLIIAELSGNHNGSIDRALKLIDAAAASGAHAVKLQTYKPQTMTLDLEDGDFLIQEKKSLWYGRSLYDLYEEAHTPWEWHEALFHRISEHGMVGFSSPFDKTAVDFLDELGVRLFKIASFEMADIPLIRYIGERQKPVIVSTGMATIAEIDETVKILRSVGCHDIVLLKCTSSYPSTPENTNIRTIPHLRELFGCEVGLSDHTRGVGVSVASVALGASVIEKHFTLDREDGGVDSDFSLEPAELEALVVESERAYLSLGKISYGPQDAEKDSLRFRRSIYVSEDVKEGDVASGENVRIIRPGFGLEPKYVDQVYGRTFRSDVKKGTALTWEMI
jgi:pseudaminic acid synthase